MLGRIVEVGSDDRHLSLERGFLVVSQRGTEVGRTPIDDVSALIGNAHGLSYSNNLLVGLAKRGVPFVLCGANHLPVGLLWPVEGHHRQAARMDAQLRATLPLRKRLWKQLVQNKIAMQAAVLELFERNSSRVRDLSRRVRAGDPANLEGQAARLYWPALLGAEFRRDRSAGGPNALLNYGYTVLRATVARHLMGAGLHPGIPLHHANAANPMRLVDDLMEPFRPLVDAWAHHLVSQGTADVTSAAKRTLALLPIRSLHGDRGVSPLTLVIQRLAHSLACCYSGELDSLELPRAEVATLSSLFEDSGEAPGATTTEAAPA
ncbi:MAG: type II CRISPR-associated endonuclease Cas1 [Thermoanaerobaculia bacterium]